VLRSLARECASDPPPRPYRAIYPRSFSRSFVRSLPPSPSFSASVSREFDVRVRYSSIATRTTTALRGSTWRKQTAHRTDRGGAGVHVTRAPTCDRVRRSFLNGAAEHTGSREGSVATSFLPPTLRARVVPPSSPRQFPIVSFVRSFDRCNSLRESARDRAKRSKQRVAARETEISIEPIERGARFGEVRSGRTCRACVVRNHVVRACRVRASVQLLRTGVLSERNTK